MLWKVHLGCCERSYLYEIRLSQLRNLHEP